MNVLYVDCFKKEVEKNLKIHLTLLPGEQCEKA